jgi:type IV pilus assembly protein PilC
MLKTTEVEQRAVFFREMATMVSAGMTIGESLDAAGQQMRFPRLRQAALEGANQARRGHPFSQIMARYPDVFTPVEIAMIHAGEESGRLDRLLGQLASYLETEYSLRQMISRETFYPKIIFGAILAFLVCVPALQKWLGSSSFLGGVVVFFEGLLAWGLIFLAGFVAYVIFRHLLVSSRELAATWDSLKLRIPVFGEAIRRLALARFSRGLAALYAAGVSLPQAVDVSADLAGNAALRLPMKAAVAKIQDGLPISEAFAPIPAMDELTLRMLQTGEQTGNIDLMMQRVAEHYEEAAISTVRRAATLTVPLATVIAGIVVFFLMLHAYAGGMAQMGNY